jgi:hypothetical protein
MSIGRRLGQRPVSTNLATPRQQQLDDGDNGDNVIRVYSNEEGTSL